MPTKINLKELVGGYKYFKKLKLDENLFIWKTNLETFEKTLENFLKFWENFRKFKNC